MNILDFLMASQGRSSVDPQALSVWNAPNPQQTADQLYQDQQRASAEHPDPSGQNPLPADIEQILYGGQGGPVQAQPVPVVPQAQALPEAVPGADQGAGADVGVQGSRLHRGLLGGTFGVGHTGGNIIGALADAFLAQGGRPLQYAPRLQQRRESETLQGFADDPMAAVSRYMAINPDNGLEAGNNILQTQARAATERRLARAAQDDYDNNTSLRVGGMIQSIRRTPDGRDNPNAASLWPRVRAEALRYAQGRGLDLSSSLPESYDPTALDIFVGQGMTPNEQIDNTENRRYNDARLADADANRQGIQSYRSQTIEERRRDRAERREGRITTTARRYLSPQEVAAAGYRPGTIVQRDNSGRDFVTQTPPRGRSRTFGGRPNEGQTRPTRDGTGTERFTGGRWVRQ